MMVRLLSLLLVSAMLLATFGCGGNDGRILANDPTTRFVNASPDATALDFLMEPEDENNQNLVPGASGLAYLQSTPGFLRTDRGDRAVMVRESGTTFEAWSEIFNFAQDEHYVFVGLGLRNFGTETEKRLRIARVVANRSLPSGNKTRLYVVHAYHSEAGFATPAIDFQHPGDNPQVRLDNIGFAEVREIEVDSIAHTFEARRTGTETVLAEVTRSLEAGKIYLLLVTGIEGAAGVNAPRLEFIELQTR
jgi:hypothetical protein